MKPWFRLTVALTLVCLAPVCLLLSFSRPARLNHALHVVGSGPWFDRGREPASDSPTASVVRSMEFDPARAGPLECLVLDCALTAGNIGPPGQVIHGPPEPVRPWRVAGQAGNPNQRHRATFSTSTKLLTFNTEFQHRAFATAFS
jgi:hypothetical protein